MKNDIIEKYFEEAVESMDCEILVQLEQNNWFSSKEEFFDAYAEEHLKKFGEEWEFAKENPTI